MANTHSMLYCEFLSMETVRSGNIKEMQPGAIKIDGDSEQAHESRIVGRTGRWAGVLAQ